MIQLQNTNGAAPSGYIPMSPAQLKEQTAEYNARMKLKKKNTHKNVNIHLKVLQMASNILVDIYN